MPKSFLMIERALRSEGSRVGLPWMRRMMEKKVRR